MDQNDNQQQGDEGVITLGSTTWNVADAFVRLKIFKPMFECDRFEIIAIYGCEDINEIVHPNEIIGRRIEAINRFKDNLRLIFENATFIIKKEDKGNFEKLRKHLTFIENMLDAISKVEDNQVTHEKVLVINEEHFRKCLRALQNIKEQIHTPLNNASIIFKQSDEMSLEELMKDIVDAG